MTIFTLIWMILTTLFTCEDALLPHQCFSCLCKDLHVLYPLTLKCTTGKQLNLIFFILVKTFVIFFHAFPIIFLLSLLLSRIIKSLVYCFQKQMKDKCFLCLPQNTEEFIRSVQTGRPTEEKMSLVQTYFLRESFTRVM